MYVPTNFKEKQIKSFFHYFYVATLIIPFFVVQPKNTVAGEGNDWRSIVKPYAMAANIKGDPSVGRIAGAEKLGPNLYP